MSIASNLLSAQSRLAELPAEMEAVASAAEKDSRELTVDELKLIEELKTEFDTLSKTIASLKQASDAMNTIAKNRVTAEVIAGATAAQQTNYGAQPITVPAKASYQRSKYFRSDRDALAAGMWIGATLAKRSDCKKWCADNSVGSYRNAMEEGTDTLGGFLVPAPLAATIIELVEEWGVFRANARNVTMTSSTLAVPKLDGSATVYFPDEGAAITASDLTIGSILLTAIKAAQLTLMSTEVNEDSVISMVDLIVRDFARGFAHSEDLGAFIGDGTGTYGTITGIKTALQAGATVTAASLAAVTLADFNAMIAKTPAYAGFTGKYYMHKSVYFGTVLPLLQAANGADMRQIEEGGNFTLNGTPVVFTQVMEQGAAGDQVAVYGDLDLGAYLGTRRDVSIRTLQELYAATDQIGVIGTMRYDVSIHSVGGATDAGAITNLIVTA